MINPLARARGLGSAKQGVHHWYVQRATAVLLLVLMGWLLYAMVSLSGGSHAQALAFIARPWNATCAVLLAIGGLYHAMLGMQVVIEDYVHTPGLELVLQFLVKAATYAGMALSIIYILRIAIS
jgi:succinate dehydrogenase / fumarate reductase membrane anchor subunit